MANLKEIKRKIGSVKNTAKTTNAMKLVSSAKLKRAEELAKRSKIYAAKLTELLNEIAAKMQNVNVDGLDNIYFKPVENPTKVDIVFITADKGLCGGFNAQTIKRVNQLLEGFKADDVKVRLRAIGRKGIDYFKFNKIELNDSIIGLSAAPTYNMITQEVREDQILPVDASKLDLNQVSTSELEIEPEDDDTLLDALVKRYVEYSMYYAI